MTARRPDTMTESNVQILNCEIALAGKRDNTVPRYGVTPAEIAVLRAIHGDDAVFEIEPTGEIVRSNAEELSRLRLTYTAVNEKRQRIVDLLFPGAAARVHTHIDELGLADVLFSRDHLERLKAAQTKSKRKKAAERPVESEPPAPDFEPVEDDDLDEVPADPESPSDGILD